MLYWHGYPTIKNAGCKWNILKQELSVRFALVSDSMHALTLLGRIRQGRNEKV